MDTLTDFLTQIPAGQRPAVRALDAAIRRAVPRLERSLKWGNLTYHGPRNVCAIASHTHHLNLQIWHGARLDDPRNLLVGSGKEMRHVRIVPGDSFDASYLEALVRQAVALSDF